jgi:hypothetical protein
MLVFFGITKMKNNHIIDVFCRIFTRIHAAKTRRYASLCMDQGLLIYGPPLTYN